MEPGKEKRKGRKSMETLAYEYRWAKVDEWIPAMDMIWRTFQKFEGDIYTEQGVKNFYEFITDYDLYRAFLNGKYRLMIALDDNKIIGAASVRDRRHLSLLFVDEAYHYRGVGRTLVDRLCDYVKTQLGEPCMTVRSSPYAVDFYKKIGFRAVSPQECIEGMFVTAMEKELVCQRKERIDLDYENF